jgi:hypothetical protein
LVTDSEAVHQRIEREADGDEVEKRFPYFRFSDLGDIGLGEWNKAEMCKDATLISILISTKAQTTELIKLN